MTPTELATVYGLSATAGLRPFLLLALAAVAVHLGWLHPSHHFDFMGTDGVALVLALLALAEIAADKIPALDNFAHAIHFATKPIAAAILVGTLIPDSALGADGGLTTANYALMGLGAFNALTVNGAVATARAASTVTTGGVANPFMSIAEDVLTVGGVVLSIFLPFVAAAVVVAFIAAVVFVARRIVRNFRLSRAVPVGAGRLAPSSTQSGGR
jgi:hypothetical protein